MTRSQKEKDAEIAKRLLRLNDEPYAYYDEVQIHQTLVSHASDFMDTLERFYYTLSKDKDLVVLPLKHVFTTKHFKGDWRVMPCMVKNFDGKIIKVVKVIGTNEEERTVKDKICVGKALLVDPADNFVQAIFDVCALSSFRSAAVSVLAFKHLAHVSDVKVGIIGAGRLGFYTGLLLFRWLGIKEVMIADPNKAHLDNFKHAAATWLPELKIKEGGLQQLCACCEALFLATDSQSPLLSAANSKHASFISSIGADADNLSEVHSSLAEERQIVTDSRQTMRFGDLKRWRDAGLIAADQVLELSEVMGKGVTKKSLFISTGIAVQDAIVCQFLFDHLKK